MTVRKGDDPAHEVPLVETRENLPEDQDPSPSMIAFNKSFGTSYRRELLSVGYEKADVRDGTSKLLTLWNSSKIVDEIGDSSRNMIIHDILLVTLVTFVTECYLSMTKF
jgi:hypothetical protein